MSGSCKDHVEEGIWKDHQHRIYGILVWRTDCSSLHSSKGGVTQLTKELSNDWIARGVNVNAIAPGYMATEMNSALLDPKNPRYQQITERIPANRWGTGDDMKGACIFLASHASDYLAERSSGRRRISCKIT